MKKILSLVLVIALAFSLVACGGAKSAEEVDKNLKAEGWESYVMPMNELEMGDFKAKEGVFATKGMSMISYVVFENSEDVNKFKKESPEVFGIKMKQSGNAVGVFIGMNDEEINKIAGKMGL